MALDYKYFTIPFATSGTRTPVPNPTQPAGTVNYTDGYGVDYSIDPEVNPVGILVERAYFNQIIFDITQALAYIQTDFPEWVSSSDNGGVPFAYKNGSVVRYSTDGNLYQSIVAANTATPGTDATKWVIFLSSYATSAALAAETARALSAEALLAPLNSPVLTGIPQAPTAPSGSTGSQLATLSFVATAVANETARAEAAEALLAPRANPTFTGNVTVPAQSVGTNNNLAATTAMVTAAVGAEATRALAAEALLAPKASPAFTGVPTVPTAAGGDSSTQIANTAWVRGLFGDFAPTVPGYIQFGGWTVQWVIGPYDPADSSEPNYTLNWDIAFPTACLVAVVSMDLASPTGSSDNWYQTYGWTTTGVNIQRQRVANVQTVATRAVAIGIGY